MIIQCEKCGGAFEPLGGVTLDRQGGRVRCMRCDHSFTVHPPPPVEPVGKRAVARLRLRLIMAAMLLLVLSLGFTATLTLTTLEKLYVESLVSKFRLIGKDLQRNIEKSLRFGKPIHNFVGMENLLDETRTRFSRGGDDAPFGDVSVSVSLPDGQILYSTDTALQTAILPESVGKWLVNLSTAPSDDEAGYIRFEDAYFLSLPLQGGFRKDLVGFVLISFDHRQVDYLLDQVLLKTAWTILIVLSVGCLALMVIIQILMPGWMRQERFPRFKVSVMLFLIIGLCQVVFMGLNARAFRTYYLEISREKAQILSRTLKEDIEYYLELGRTIDKMVGLDKLIGEIIGAAPELDSITLFDDDGRPLMIVTRDGAIDFKKAMTESPVLAHGFITSFDTDYNLRMEIFKEGELEGYMSTEINEGYISTTLSKDVVMGRLLKILLDSITVLAISLLFFFEMLILVFQFINRETASEKDRKRVHFIVARPAAFLLLFGVDTCLSFLPLHMANLYEPIFGLSRDIVVGLPISVEMFFAGLSTFLSGAWLDRRGWHEPFITGLFMAGLGTLYSWLAPDAINFIASRGVVGMGYGLCIMSSQGFIFATTNEKNKAQGLSQLFAGIFAGSICGGAAGGMLAERLGYGPVFLVGACAILMVLPYTLYFMRGAMGRPVAEATAIPVERFSIGSLFRFLFNRNIASLVLFSSIPASIAVVGFLNYFTPIYLKQIGTSQSDIGRIIMIYGICLIYVAPLISRYFDAAANKKAYIALSGFIGGVAFIVFYHFGGMAAVAAAIFLLGLSGSFGAARRAYALSQPATLKLGSGVAMGIYNSTGRMGQVAGPMVFGLMLTFGVDKGFTYLGGIYLIITMLFLITAQNDRKVQTAGAVGG